MVNIRLVSQLSSARRMSPYAAKAWRYEEASTASTKIADAEKSMVRKKAIHVITIILCTNCWRAVDELWKTMASGQGSQVIAPDFANVHGLFLRVNQICAGSDFVSDEWGLDFRIARS
jgi:hypothetical protein